MSDFDPNVEPESDEAMDAYVLWCTDNLVRVFGYDIKTYRTAVRCAHWLLVISTSQMRLHGEVEADRDALEAQLQMYAKLARAVERQREHFAIERLITLRSSLDCWASVGGWAEGLLACAKSAVSALMLTELYPMVDLWDLECPEIWEMLSAAADALAVAPEDVESEDCTVKPNEMVIAKFTWQRANNISRRAGFTSDLSPN